METNPTKQPTRENFEIEELRVWNYLESRFLDVLNGEISLEEAREDLKSFRNSKYYTGTKEEYKIIKEDEN